MLDDIALFIKLYDTQSFKKCAELLNMKASTVSKHIMNLEYTLGKSLITRTSRSFKPTKFGKYIYCQFKHISSYTQEVLNTYNKNSKENKSSGVLNVSMSAAISYELICPVLDEFIKLNPNTQLNMDFTINITNWPTDNTDIVLSVNPINNPNFENRFLRTEYAYLYCRTEYVLKYGIPLEPEELVNHKIIGTMDVNKNPLNHLVLKNNKTNKEFLVDTSNVSIRVNNPLHLRRIGLESDFIFGTWDSLCVRDIEKENLIKVLPEWSAFEIDFYLVTHKIVTPRQQSFIDFIYHCMSRDYCHVLQRT